jgi:hypothetical protein
MPREQAKFKPFCGRCFELKAYTNTKKYPSPILVMDETKDKVMFLDNDGTATWISKFYLRDKPLDSRVFASPDTVGGVISLVEKMRAHMIQSPPFVDDKKKLNELNKLCGRAVQELRDLGNRMQGVKFAPPMVETDSSEEP